MPGGGKRLAQDLVEVVTSEAEVEKLHNLYFSTPWLQFGRSPFFEIEDDAIVMHHL